MLLARGPFVYIVLSAEISSLLPVTNGRAGAR